MQTSSAGMLGHKALGAAAVAAAVTTPRNLVRQRADKQTCKHQGLGLKDAGMTVWEWSYRHGCSCQCRDPDMW